MRTARATAMNVEGGASLRQRILDEAIDLVSQKGGETITMRALANRLGYSPATIYLHFRNKDDLQREIARHGFGVLSQRMIPASQIEDPSEALRELSRRYVAFALESPALYRVMFGDQDLSYRANGSLDYPGRELAEAMREFHARGIESGAFRAGDPEEQAVLGWSMLHGFSTLAVDGRMPPPRLPEQTVMHMRDQLIEAWLRALRP